MVNPYISALCVYPVKSCAGIRYDQAELVERGLRYDRQWMVVDPANKFITQREVASMALVKTQLTDHQLILTAPNLTPLSIPLAEHDGERVDVTVWKDTCQAVDEGEEAAQWISAALGTDARLVRMPPSTERLTSTDYTDVPGTVSFADGYPLLFISEASLEDLNTCLTARGKDTLPMNRFRPNVVVAGCEPYAEDTWQQITIGDIAFDVVKPCARCVITTVDQSIGVSPDIKEPLATLATYRRGKNGGAMFGQNVLHRSLGVLHVGDQIEVLKQEPNRYMESTAAK
jgi:uncharacterized protein YcbX